jgi:hypothetical protein
MNQAKFFRAVFRVPSGGGFGKKGKGVEGSQRMRYGRRKNIVLAPGGA